jgi:hypothetical protein
MDARGPRRQPTATDTVAKFHRQLVNLIAMLNPDLATYVQRTSAVAAVLAERRVSVEVMGPLTHER